VFRWRRTDLSEKSVCLINGVAIVCHESSSLGLHRAGLKVRTTTSSSSKRGATGPSIPAVALTAQVSIEDESRALAEGFSEFVWLSSTS
jgi:hypothetical protein